MSYDLIAFKSPDGMHAGEAYQQLVDAEEHDRPPPQPLDAELRRCLAAELERTLGLERFEDGDSFELSSEDSLGLQVSFFEGSISIALPFWHSDAATHAFNLIGACIRILRDQGQLTIFDPQDGMPIVTDADIDQARARYEASCGVTAKALEPRPWWKFW